MRVCCPWRNCQHCSGKSNHLSPSNCIFLKLKLFCSFLLSPLLTSQRLQDDLKTNKDAYPFDEVCFNPFGVVRLDFNLLF